MKILHTADWHLGKKLDRFSRLEEQKLVLDEICAIADNEAVDLILIAGDLFDNFNPPAEAQDLFYRTVYRLSKNGTRPVVAIAGNHDMPERIEAPMPLAQANAIILNGFPNAAVKPFQSDGGVIVTRSESGFIEILPRVDSAPIRILLMPYANELRLKTCLGEGEEALNPLLEKHWKELAEKYCDPNGVNLLMAHLYFMKEGAEPEPEEEGEKSILHIGGAQPVITSILPNQLQYVALGHLHRFHYVDHNPCPVVYSSSPLSYSFAEAGQMKKVVIIEAEPGQQATVRPIELKQGMPLLRQEFNSIEAAVLWLEGNPNTYVEITILTTTFLDGAVRKILADAHEFIVDVIPKIISEGENGQPDEEIFTPDASHDMETLFIEFFKSRNKTLEPSESIRSLFREVLNQEDSI